MSVGRYNTLFRVLLPRGSRAGPVGPAWRIERGKSVPRQSGGRLLAVNAGARAPRGGVTRQGVVLTDLRSLCDCQ
jgi:hypothetical protein